MSSSRAFRIGRSLVLASATLIGCADDPGASGEGGQGGAGAGGQGGEGATTSGPGGQGGDDLIQICLEHGKASTVLPSWRIHIRFVNETGADLFLGDTLASCDPTPPYVVEDASGLRKAHLGSCEFGCSSLILNGCDCPEACPQPQVVRIAAGGHHEIEWHGSVYRDLTMADGCYADASCAGRTCYEPEIPAGLLEIHGSAFLELGDCDDATCTCTPDDEGSCVVAGATLVAGAPRIVSASQEVIEHEARVELVFD